MGIARTQLVAGQRRRILLVEDHAVVRFALTQLIRREADLIVCGEEDDALGALDAIVRHNPDLILVDITLKNSSGLELTREIKARHPELPVLVLSAHEESIHAERAFEAGAAGYVMKDQPLEKVLDAIRKVLNGSLYISEPLSRRLLQRRLSIVKRPAAKTPLAQLTPREMKVFIGIGQWKNAAELAAELGIALKTVQHYQRQIYCKLGLKGTAELRRYAATWTEETHAA